MSSSPSEKLWLNIDYSKIDFKDMKQVNLIYTWVPETRDRLNEMYKVYQKNKKNKQDKLKSILNIDNPSRISIFLSRLLSYILKIYHKVCYSISLMITNK